MADKNARLTPHGSHPDRWKVSCSLTLATLATLATLLPVPAAAQEDPPPGEKPPLPPPVPAQDRPQQGVNLDAPPGPPRQPGFARPRQVNPAQPLPTAGEQREQTPPGQRGRVVVENADTSSYREIDDVLVLSGNVRISYNGYTSRSDRATYQRNNKLLTFSGDVELRFADQVIYADQVSVQTDTNEFFSRDGRTVLPPEKVGQQIVQPVRLSGSTLTRLGRNFQATGGFLTTCDFPNPHYKIGFRQADLLPNDRLVLRDAVIYRYEKPIFRIPYLVIPVREGRAFSYLPYIGRTNEEGWFIKVVLGYSLSRTLPGLLRIDLMEKKGVGLGFDQAYQFGERSAGNLAFYNLQDRNRGVSNSNGRVNHQQLIGDTLATIATDFQNNSYQSLTANSQTSTTTVTLARTTDARTTNISLSTNQSDYGTSKSQNRSYTLSQTENINRDSTITFRFNGTDSTSRNTSGANSAVSGREEQTGDIQARTRLSLLGVGFDAEVNANRNFLVRQKGSVGGAAFSGTQRLPDIVLSTDSDRVGGFLERYLPATIKLGYGRFLENVTTSIGGQLNSRAVTTTRWLFDADLRPRPMPLTPGGGLTLTAAGNFRQTYYRSDAAQYLLTGRLGLSQKLTRDANLNLNYNYLRPYGGTPLEFRLDQTGSSNTLASSLTVSSYRVKLSLLTGYDIQRAWTDTAPGIRRNPWQNLGIQLAFRPSDILQSRFQASYDINSGRLLDLNNRSRITGRGGFALDTGMRYDPRRKRISQITEVLTLPLFSRDVTLTVLSGYNGNTNKFDYKQFTLIQAFHDYDLIYGYADQPFGFRREQGFSFTIRLRAFPTFRPTAGGQYGTPLDTGVGEVF